jgi:O-antigen/teichoic acid export membrane protein
MSSLRKQTVQGVIWTFFGNSGNHVFSLIISIILARLLLPKEFGLIAMIMIFIELSNLLIDSGFSAALIQKRNVDRKDYDSVFYLNVIFSIVIYGIVYFLAPMIAEFYNENSLTAITRIIALVVPFNAMSLVQNTILRKNLDFKKLSLIQLSSVPVAGLIAILFALSGYGVWSLVVRTVSNSFLNTILFWKFNDWRPSLNFSLRSIKKYHSFSFRLLITEFFNIVSKNLYRVIIGKYFLATELGYYARAKDYSELFSIQIARTMRTVTFPSFSKIHDDKDKLKSGLSLTIKLTMLVVIPLMAGLFVTAETFIRVLLTNKWLPVVPYLRILCVVGIFFPLNNLIHNIFFAKGEGKLILNLNILNKTLLMINIFISINWGVLGLVVGQVIHVFISNLFYTYYSQRLVGYGFLNLIKDIYQYIFAAFIMSVLIFSIGMVIDNNVIRLIIQSLFGLIIYYSICYFFKFDGLIQVKSIINNELRNKSN